MNYSIRLYKNYGGIVQIHIADKNMKKFFEKLLAIKDFVSDELIKAENSYDNDKVIKSLREIYDKLDAIIKNGDTNE